MERLRPRPVVAFAAITLFIWGNRIWLAWTNTEDSVAEKLVWSTSITLFVIASIAVLAILLRGGDPTAIGTLAGKLANAAPRLVQPWRATLRFLGASGK